MSPLPPGRGLSFVDAMVRAIHAGMKTQTRRTMVPQPTASQSVDYDSVLGWHLCEEAGMDPGMARKYTPLRAPYPGPDGVVWLQENLRKEGNFAVYASDGRPVLRAEAGALVEARWPWKNKTLPARYCPRWAWRTPVRVVDLGAARLLELTAEQAWAEGLLALDTREAVLGMGGPVARYLKLWDEINAARGYPSSGNPWLWALSFRLFTWEEVALLPEWPGKGAVYLGVGG